jgi:hypothetical protein
VEYPTRQKYLIIEQFERSVRELGKPILARPNLPDWEATNRFKTNDAFKLGLTVLAENQPFIQEWPTAMAALPNLADLILGYHEMTRVLWFFVTKKLAKLPENTLLEFSLYYHYIADVGLRTKNTLDELVSRQSNIVG